MYWLRSDCYQKSHITRSLLDELQSQPLRSNVQLGVSVPRKDSLKPFLRGVQFVWLPPRIACNSTASICHVRRMLRHAIFLNSVSFWHGITMWYCSIQVFTHVSVDNKATQYIPNLWLLPSANECSQPSPLVWENSPACWVDVSDLCCCVVASMLDV